MDIFFFDQNIAGRFCRKGEQDFRDNVWTAIGLPFSIGVVRTPLSILEFLGLTPDPTRWEHYQDEWLSRCTTVPSEYGPKLMESLALARSHYAKCLPFSTIKHCYRRNSCKYWDIQNKLVVNLVDAYFSKFVNADTSAVESLFHDSLAGLSLQLAVKESTPEQIFYSLYGSCREENFGKFAQQLHLSSYRLAIKFALKRATEAKESDLVEHARSCFLKQNGDLVDAEGISLSCLGTTECNQNGEVSIVPVTFVTGDDPNIIKNRVSLFKILHKHMDSYLAKRNCNISHDYQVGNVLCLDKTTGVLMETVYIQ